MAFKMKGMPGIAGVKAEEDLKNELSGKTQEVMEVKPKDEFSTIASRRKIYKDRYPGEQELGGRWQGMTLAEFDANVKEERESIGDDPKTLKAFDIRQAKLREQAIKAD